MRVRNGACPDLGTEAGHALPIQPGYWLALPCLAARVPAGAIVNLRMLRRWDRHATAN